jgi:hypothetical protein
VTRLSRLPALALGTFVALVCSIGAAMPERTVAIGVGAGVPEVVFGSIDVAASRHWQIGLSYGVDGGLLGQALGFDGLRTSAQAGRDIVLSDGRTYRITPQLDPLAFSVWTPSVRFFPTERNFYFQLSWTLLRLGSTFQSGIADPVLGIALDGVLFGTVSYVQHLPTLFIGHVWSSKAFFFNVRLGASFPFVTSLTITTRAQLPAIVGGVGPNQQAIQAFSDELAAEAVRAVDEAKREIPVIPSVALVAGFFL